MKSWLPEVLIILSKNDLFFLEKYVQDAKTIFFGKKYAKI
jgi:hypothetical protein